MTDGPLAAARFVQFAALMVLAGSSLFVLAAGGAALPRWMTRTAAVTALVSALGWLVAAAAAMSDRPLAAVDGATMALVLNETAFGAVWRVQLALAAILAAASWWRSRSGAILALATALLAGAAAVGHAGMASGVAGLLRIAGDALHLLAAAAWLGGLLPLALLLRQLEDASVPPATLRTVERFSALAMAAVAVLVVTGMANLQGLLPSPAGLDSPWGRVLVIKLALVAGLLALAAINRFVLLPRLRHSVAPARQRPAILAFRFTVLLEQGLALLVLTAASLLGTLPPPIIGAAATPSL